MMYAERAGSHEGISYDYTWNGIIKLKKDGTLARTWMG